MTDEKTDPDGQCLEDELSLWMTSAAQNVANTIAERIPCFFDYVWIDPADLASDRVIH